MTGVRHPHYEELALATQVLEGELHEAAPGLHFEYVARERDTINEPRRALRDAG